MESNYQFTKRLYADLISFLRWQGDTKNFALAEKNWKELEKLYADDPVDKA